MHCLLQSRCRSITELAGTVSRCGHMRGTAISCASATCPQPYLLVELDQCERGLHQSKAEADALASAIAKGQMGAWDHLQ
jgi:hypothetical protein